MTRSTSTMQSKSLIPSVLFALLLVSALLGCGSDEETSVETLQPSLESSTLTPQEIAKIALQSTVFLQIKKPDQNITGSGFVVDDNLVVSALVVRSPSMIWPVSDPLVNDTVTPVSNVSDFVSRYIFHFFDLTLCVCYGRMSFCFAAVPWQQLYEVRKSKSV